MARSQFEEALLTHKSLILGWMRDFSQQSNVNVHELSGGLHTGGLSDAQAPQFLKVDGSRQLSGNLSVLDGVTIDGVDIGAHAGDANAHHAAVTILDSPSIDFSLTGQQVSGSVIASSDVSAVTEELVLKSTAAGGLKLKQLEITNDLTVGNNVLNVDVTTSNIGINCVPDSQFDLDVAGNLRAQGWIVGKHALQVKDAVMICHFDGAEPYNTDFSGNPTGHMGQVAAITGGVIYRPGKFGKAVQVGGATTNLLKNPTFENSSRVYSLSTYVVWGSGSSNDGGTNRLFIGRAVRITATTTSNPEMYTDFHPFTTITEGTPYAVQFWARADANRNISFRVKLSISPNTTLYIKNISLNSEWQKISFVFNMPAGCTTDYRAFISMSGGVTGQWIEIAEYQLEQSEIPTAFCVGYLPDHSWSGTAYASTSTRSLSKVEFDGMLPADLKDRGSIGFWFNPTNAMNTTQVSTSNADIFRLLFSDNENTGSIWLRFVTGGSNNAGLVIYTNGTLTQSYKNLSANTWYYVTYTWNKNTAEAHIYLNGALIASGSTFNGFEYGSRTTPLLTFNEANTLSALFDDFVLFSRALSADEIIAIYESDAPIFAETSTWSWRTPTNLAWADANGLWARDTNSYDAFGVSGVDGYSWGGFSLDAGDIVLGRNVSGSSAIKWDISTGTFGFYGGGSGTVQVQIGTDGALLAGAGAMKINAKGQKFYGTGTAGEDRTIEWYDTSDGNRLIAKVKGDYGGVEGVAWIQAWKKTGDPWTHPQVILAAIDDTASKDIRLVVRTDYEEIFSSAKFTSQLGFQIAATSTTPATRGGYGTLYVNSSGQLMYKKPGGTTHTVVA